VVPSLTPDVRVYPDLDTLSRAMAESVVLKIREAISGRGRCGLALAGGDPPRTLYRLLATEHQARIPWAQVHVFWADERYVPPDDSQSNYRLARESLLDQIPIPPGNVHPMPTNLPKPDDAALIYERTLRENLPAPRSRLDLVLLGLGADGHTASLFPDSPAIEEQNRWAMAIRAPAEPALRLTLTLAVINHAAHVAFLVAGLEKAEALRLALVDAPPPRLCPAAGVRPTHGAVVWWIDIAAASLLPPGTARKL